jgi:type VII secretion integral membrane protein EccD
VLQRLGEPPLDENQTLEELALTDGEALHLRPRSELIPPLDFDDLIDGIATGMAKRSALWRPSWTRAAALSVATLGLAVALLVVGLGGPPLTRVLTAGATAVVLLGGSWVAARKARDRVVGGLLAGAAVAFAGLAALLVGAASAPGTPVGQGQALICAAVAVAATGLLAVELLAVRRRAPWAVGLLLVATIGAIAGALRGQIGLGVEQVAAVLILIAAAVRPSVPLIAFRLSGLRLPALPVAVEDLQTEIDPEPGAEVLAGAEAADDQMTAIQAALGLTSGLALVTLACRPGWFAWVTVVVAALPPLLALRGMTSAWQRLALGVPSLAALLTVAVTAATHLDPQLRPALVLGLVAAAGTIAAAAHTLPQRRVTPIWGRIGDIVHLITLGALVPLAVGLLGGYGRIRGMVG